MGKKIRDGGLRILHFKSQVKSLLLNWLKHLLSENGEKWKHILKAVVPFIDIKYLFLIRCYLTLMNCGSCLYFIKYLLCTWS